VRRRWPTTLGSRCRHDNGDCAYVVGSSVRYCPDRNRSSTSTEAAHPMIDYSECEVCGAPGEVYFDGCDENGEAHFGITYEDCACESGEDDDAVDA
jgi:hypothetical protein